jgi:hypothetical protein
MSKNITIFNFYELLISGQKSKHEFKQFFDSCREDWRNIRQGDIRDLKNSMLIYDLYFPNKSLPNINLRSLNTPRLRRQHLINYQLKRLGF